MVNIIALLGAMAYTSIAGTISVIATDAFCDALGIDAEDGSVLDVWSETAEDLCGDTLKEIETMLTKK